MGKIAENKLQKMNSLLHTAFELFTTQGFSKTSIADIAQKAGVAKGTFYLYFKDKYDLREKIIHYEVEKLFAHALEYSDYREKADFTEKLIAIIDDVLDQMAQQPLLVKFINKNLSWGVFNRSLSHAEADEINIHAKIDELMAQDGAAYDAPDIMFYTVICLVSNACHSVIIEKQPVDLETYKPYLYKAIRSVIRMHRL